MWAADIEENESVIARALVNGIVRDGLRFQSIDSKKLKYDNEFRGNPYVGYCAMTWHKPIILRAETLEHFLVVFRTGAEPSREIIRDEFVSKSDFRTWLLATEQKPPPFWYSLDERENEA